MSPVTVDVARGVHARWGETGGVFGEEAFVEGSSSNEFLVAQVFFEFTMALPLWRDFRHVGVVEAPRLRPYAGVDDSNNDVLAVVGFRPGAGEIVEAEKFR